MKLHSIDEYGIKNWHPTVKILAGLLALYTYIAIMSFPMMWAEIGAEGSKLTNYRDTFWLLQMAASTIGFGEVYPVTETGRAIVAITFYVGMGVAGFVAATFAMIGFGFMDTSVQNRELRKQNETIIKLLEERDDTN